MTDTATKAKIKGILINPNLRTIEMVEIEDGLDPLRKAIDVDLITAVGGFGPNRDNDLIVDDEGLLKEPPPVEYFVMRHYAQPLAGNGILLSHNDEGDSISTTLDLTWARHNIAFVRLSMNGFKPYESKTGPGHWLGEGAPIVGHVPQFSLPPEMGNKAMERKLLQGEAIDVADYKREGSYYLVPKFVEGKDYCDSRHEAWIWSIGRRHADGKVLASTAADLYQNPAFECLWLR